MLRQAPDCRGLRTRCHCEFIVEHDTIFRSRLHCPVSLNVRVVDAFHFFFCALMWKSVFLLSDGVVLHPQPGRWARENVPAVPSSTRPPVPPSRPVRHSSYKDTLQLHGKNSRDPSFPLEHHQKYGVSFRETPSHRNYSPHGHPDFYDGEQRNSPRVYLPDTYGNGADVRNSRTNARDRPVQYITASQV